MKRIHRFIVAGVACAIAASVAVATSPIADGIAQPSQPSKPRVKKQPERPSPPPSLAPSMEGLLVGSENEADADAAAGDTRPPKWKHPRRAGKPVSGGGVASFQHSGRAKQTRAAGSGARAIDNAKTLVLYDSTGPYGWLGELYGMYVANLTSHFGSWTAQPVSTYTAGRVDAYTAVIYIGSTYDEALPATFLSDVRSTSKPVVWMYNNIWQLTNSTPTFAADYGWQWKQYDTSDVASVDYKGTSLTRSLDNRSGIMDYASLDTSKVTTLATAKRADGTSFPWAVRSKNLTYIGEIPFSYTSETDRDAIFSDLLFDALAPATPERHRALVRIEDLSPQSDPAQLRAVADVLYARRIPFGFGVSPVFKDPLRKQSSVTSRSLAAAPQVVSAIKYMQARGGVMIEHGYTHQYSNAPNPYDAVSGNDFEFYRTVERPDHTLDFRGPVPGDSASWAGGRMDAAGLEFIRAGLAVPKIFEFPHYSSSVVGYKEAAKRFSTRWERALYFSGQFSGTPIDYTRPIGQRFPFVVRDVYGSLVLPENIGSYEPEAFYQFPVHTVGDILAGAKANKVVRDGFASFYYHPFWGTSALVQAVDGLKASGWTFVSPATLAADGQ